MVWVVIGCILGALILAAVVVCAALLCRRPRFPAHIEGSGFVQARGEHLYDGAGELLQLKGVNFVNRFIQEPWMSLASVGSFDTGRYTQRRGRAAMLQNPNLSAAQAEELGNGKALGIEGGQIEHGAEGQTDQGGGQAVAALVQQHPEEQIDAQAHEQGG